MLSEGFSAPGAKSSILPLLNAAWSRGGPFGFTWASFSGPRTWSLFIRAGKWTRRCGGTISFHCGGGGALGRARLVARPIGHIYLLYRHAFSGPWFYECVCVAIHLSRSGRTDEALANYKKAFELYPDATTADKISGR
jgi:hypothetical protein